MLLLAASVTNGESVAQSQSSTGADETADPGFVEVVDVDVVNVDVWVTDADGKPVNGLDRDDFEVLQDGEPVQVTNFYAVESGAPAGLEAAAAEPATVDVAQVALQASEPVLAPEHRLWVIVFVDNLNIDPTERNRVLPALDRFLLRVLDEGGQAMVVSYDRFLEVRQPFTDQPGLLADTVRALKDDAGLRAIRRREQMEVLRMIDDADSVNQAMPHAVRYAEELRNEVDFTVDALERLLESLAGLPGRKALVHVSSGVSMAAGEEMFHVIADRFGVTQPYSEIPRHDVSRRFEAVARQANAHRVAFYTLDAGGLRGIEFGSAEYGGFVNMGIRRTLDSVVPENLQAPLRLLADETGGRAIVNRNDVMPALDEVVQDLGSFYSLGITSPDNDNARYHQIKVRLRNPQRGVRLRYRGGYRTKSRQTRIEESLRSALLYNHQSNPLRVEVAWGEQEPHGDEDLYLLPIRLSVPLSGVALLPTGEAKYEARMRLFVAAADERGDLSEIDDVPFGVRVAEEHAEAAAGESLLHQHKLLLPEGPQRVGIAVLDELGGRYSVVTAIIQIGAQPAGPSGRGGGSASSG